MDLLNALKSFATVVEKQSFSMAATHLNLSVAQVSKNVSWLEEQFKTNLLSRSTRRIIATDAGQRFFLYCQRILTEWDDAKNNIESLQEIPQGNLKIRLPLHSFGICQIANNIPAFLKRYPKLKIELLFQSSHEANFDQNTDITVHVGNLKGNETFHAKQVGILTKGVFATPAYLQLNGCPQVPEDLLHHNCIVFLKGKTNNAWVFKHQKINVSGNYRTNSVYALRDAAKANMGLVWMSHLWAAKDLADGNLTEVLTDFVAPGEPIYLIYKHHPSALSLPIKCFISYLKEIL